MVCHGGSSSEEHKRVAIPCRSLILDFFGIRRAWNRDVKKWHVKQRPKLKFFQQFFYKQLITFTPDPCSDVIDFCWINCCSIVTIFVVQDIGAPPTNNNNLLVALTIFDQVAAMGFSSQAHCRTLTPGIGRQIKKPGLPKSWDGLCEN